MTFIPKFENILNWGNIITLVVLGLGGVIAFIKMQTEMEHFVDLAQELRKDQAEYEVRLRAVELGFGRVEERLIAIQSGLAQLVQQQNQRNQP